MKKTVLIFSVFAAFQSVAYAGGPVPAQKPSLEKQSSISLLSRSTSRLGRGLGFGYEERDTFLDLRASFVGNLDGSKNMSSLLDLDFLCALYPKPLNSENLGFGMGMFGKGNESYYSAGMVALTDCRVIRPES